MVGGILRLFGDDLNRILIESGITITPPFRIIRSQSYFYSEGNGLMICREECKKSTIYNDSQNIHMSSINNSVKESIDRILSLKI